MKGTNYAAHDALANVIYFYALHWKSRQTEPLLSLHKFINKAATINSKILMFGTIYLLIGKYPMHHYPDFKYPALDLKRFIHSKNFFTILLATGKIVHFETKDEIGFRSWLEAHGIQDIEKE